MSFILQGTSRELRFSGETAIVHPDELLPSTPAIPIGRPRVRRPRRAAPEDLDAMMCFSPWPLGAWAAPSKSKVARSVAEQRPQTQPMATAPAVRERAPAPAPAPAGPVTVPAPMSLAAPFGAVSIRRKIGELATRFPHAIERKPKLAIPFFRSAIPANDAPPRAVAKAAAPAKRPSLRIWLVASVLIGLVSYEVASHVMERVAPPGMTASR